MFFQADPSADNSNRESSYDDGKRVGGASSVLTRADNSDNNRQTSNGYSNYGGSSDNNNRQSPTGNSNYGGSSDSNNRQYVPNNSNRDGYPDSNKSPVITFDYGGGSGSSGDNNRQGFTNNNRPSLSNDPIGVDLNRGAFNYAPYNVETTTMNYQNSDRRKEENYLSNSMTSYQGVNNQNTQEFQRPANSNHIRNQDIASNMKMVPDMNPILSPDQKISISIEYPTVNYERDDAECELSHLVVYFACFIVVFFRFNSSASEAAEQKSNHRKIPMNHFWAAKGWI